MNVLSDRDMCHQVDTALGEHAAGFDVPGIVRDVIARYGRVDIDQVHGPVFWEIVAHHDKGVATS